MLCTTLKSELYKISKRKMRMRSLEIFLKSVGLSPHSRPLARRHKMSAAAPVTCVSVQPFVMAYLSVLYPVPEEYKTAFTIDIGSQVRSNAASVYIS